MIKGRFLIFEHDKYMDLINVYRSDNLMFIQKISVELFRRLSRNGKRALKEGLRMILDGDLPEGHNLIFHKFKDGTIAVVR